MWTEYILLLVISVSLLSTVGSSLGLFSVGGGDRSGFFQSAVPRLSARIERNIITGYQFCTDHNNNPNTKSEGCSWD